MTAVAHFPRTLDNGLLERARRPLATIAAIILAIDLIALGLHLTDAVDSPIANDAPTRAKARVGAPDAVVPGSSVFGSQTDRRSAARAGQPAQPQGCLALDSGCYPGDTTTPGQPAGPPAPTPPPGEAPVPVAQADLAVPALGTQVSFGVGPGSCTSVVLTAIALGDCPVESGDGPVVLNLGGSLLGG